MNEHISGISVCADRKGEWDQNANRRQGLKDLHRLHRYGISLRAPKSVELFPAFDERIGSLDRVRAFCNHEAFVGLCVLTDRAMLFEQRAADFGAHDIHSVQSISKTLVFLIAGRLVEKGLLNMEAMVRDYIPEIGSGYRHATVQALFDMAVINDYHEDYADGEAMIGELEDAHGWRILKNHDHVNLQTFLQTIPGDGTPNTDYTHSYKTANTDLAAWICERVSGCRLRDLTLEIIEAAGVEDPVVVSTDRSGTPFLGGGLHMSLRDLARYGRLLGNAGMHGAGHSVSSRTFFDTTKTEASKGTATPVGCRYRNFTFTDGHWIGHLGYGGQWLMAFPDTGLVIACLAALAGDDAIDMNFIKHLPDMGQDISNLLGD